MTTSEIETLLEAARETQSLEFKSAMSWDVRKLARSLLALANVEDGGIIVIGIRNDGTREGLSPIEVQTYKLDGMKDQLRNYADPHVDFSFEIAIDKGGLSLGVIRVFPFRDTPVICCKDDDAARTRNGIIYYRNTDRRPESAPVSNSYDMRSIVQSAAFRMFRRFRAHGAFTVSDDSERFDQELEGL